eukprot:TRINITY_DN767_c0_g1_i9.p1 TRINITY_DN767_c0_g1~~TRINITY_DN767_c0_g1_i9.p1  ORF type:complete len:717 (+),score=171.69 TRINITY_DN767_c0_g1_i9:91-2241(+)
MIRRPPRSTLSSSSAASDVYKRQAHDSEVGTSTSPIVFEICGYEAGTSGWKQLHVSRPLTSRNQMYEIQLDVSGLDGLQIACWVDGKSLANAHAIWIDPRVTVNDYEAFADTHSGLPECTRYKLPDDVARVHHEGWMEKKGDDLLGLWSNRFFVLDGHLLRWFSDQSSYAEGQEANGQLHLNDVSAIHQWQNKPNDVNVDVAGRTYILRCKSGQDASTWVGLMHFIGQLEDRLLGRVESGDFKNQFKLHEVLSSGLRKTDLHFDENRGVSCDNESWQAATRDIHGFMKQDGGNGNRFALVTYNYKEFEGASQAQLRQIQDTLNTLKGNREKPAISQIRVFKQASLNLFDDSAEFLAKGGYGQVFKVKEKATGEYYALKVIQVGQKFDKEFIESSIKEKEVLVGIASGNPFLVNLHSLWHENLNVFFCLELAEAGDLTNVMRTHYREQLPAALAGFYFAETVNALRFLHHLGIVYRDLKPENLLVAADGHVKLTDFGLAKGGLDDSMMTEGCTTFKGTPEYYAPEVLQAGKKDGHTYGLAADWWAVGILVYEMHAGLYTTPFPSGNRDQGALNRMYSKILNSDFQWAEPIPAWAKNLNSLQDLISQLLRRDPNSRLGTPAPGLKARSGDGIRDHPYFATELPALLGLDQPIDIDMIDKQYVTPPWIPEIPRKIRPKQSLSKFKGSRDDERLEMIGSFSGSQAECTDGVDFLAEMGFM